MTTLLIPPAVWLLLLATLILFSFIAFAIGTPGTGRIKTTMNAALVSWGTSYVLQAFIFSFEATQLVPPSWLFMAPTISVLLLAPLWGEFYFQPKGPKIRRSCTTAWKKDSPNSSFLYTSGKRVMLMVSLLSLK